MRARLPSKRVPARVRSGVSLKGVCRKKSKHARVSKSSESTECSNDRSCSLSLSCRIRSRGYSHVRPPIRNLAGCHHVFSYWDLLVLHGCQAVLLICFTGVGYLCRLSRALLSVSCTAVRESVLHSCSGFLAVFLPASIHLTLATNAAVWSKHGMLFTAHSRLVYSGHRLVDIGARRLFR